MRAMLPTGVRRIGVPGVVLVLLVGLALVLAGAGRMDGSWLAVVGAGALLAVHGLAKARLRRAAYGWQRVPAVVVSRQVVEVWTAGFPRFRPLLVFDVRVGGATERSTRFSLDDEEHEGERAVVEDLLRCYAPGTAFDAFADPRKGQQAVACIAIPEGRAAHDRVCMLAGIALVLAGLAGGVFVP